MLNEEKKSIRDYNVVILILGGGKGTRLHPLTKNRSKPAVPIGGKYRIVDVPISNSINSGFNKIYVVTQFNSASLHTHLNSTYRFDSFSDGFVEILAAEQRSDSNTWYEGTADAVRKNLTHFPSNIDYFIILSGDQLYKMDLRTYLKQHIKNKADVTIAVTPVNRKDAAGFGVVETDEDNNIKAFIEKPDLNKNIDNIKIPKSLHPDKDMQKQGKEFMGSMGIYCFNAKVLYDCLDKDKHSKYGNKNDFGGDIIPNMIEDYKLQTYIFCGFWEDIGTIRSFYDTSLALISENPVFDFNDTKFRIYSHKNNLSPSKFINSICNNVLASDGCIVKNSKIKNSILGIRSFVDDNSELENVIFMGSDYYDDNLQSIKLGCNKNSIIKNAIIDKNVSIGNNVKIGLNTPQNGEYNVGQDDYYVVKDGIIIISKDAIIKDNTVI